MKKNEFDNKTIAEESNNQDSYREEILAVRRVSAKRTGGSKFSYSVLCAVGDEHGKIGVALAKSNENIKAIAKAKLKARKSIVSVNITKDGTIPHSLMIKKNSSQILLKPAPLGTGIMAGGTVRTILELLGVKNVSARVIGTSNPVMNTYALLEGLKKLKKSNKKADKE